MTRKLKTVIKRSLFSIYKIGLKLGLVIIPKHYYSAFADLESLKASKESWQKPSQMIGIEANTESQLKELKNTLSSFQEEYKGNKFYKEGVKKHYGPGYGYIEAQVLHAFLRKHKSKRIIEVGSGVSTYCSMKATELNDNKAKISSIEPYPSEKLKKEQKIEIIQKPVQSVELDFFKQLEAGDLLFIDSSHTVKPGSDVNYLILEVLPCLKKGVLIHVHDIYFPFDYQRDIFTNFFQWQETSLLRAYLTHNPKIRILFSMSMLHYEKKEELKALLPEYRPQEDYFGFNAKGQKAFENIEEHFPSSIYLEVL